MSDTDAAPPAPGDSPESADPIGADGVGTGQGFDRFVNFSDAVVAIAITLLGLSLIDIRAPGPDQTAWEVLSQHGGELSAFAYSFLVVAFLWMAHHRVFGFFRGYDPAIMWFNLLFLIAIVLLPFPSEWVGEHGFEDGMGTFYLLTLFTASAALGLITWHAVRKPALLQPWARAGGSRPLSARRSAIYTAYFGGCALLSTVAPAFTSWLMLGLIPLSVLERRLSRRSVESP